MSHKNTYLSEVNLKETNPLLVSLSHLAQQQNIPIIHPEGLAFLRQLIRLKEIVSILEIGTAIGYSSMGMAMVDSNIKISTIERNEERYLFAKNQIENSPYKDQITLYKGDALTDDLGIEGPFDMIFIDAAKAQNRTLFERYESLLSKRGIIVVDNLLFHEIVGTKPASRNLRALIRKIDEFNHYIVKREDYHTYLYPIGDGMSLSIKR